ncbi:MAG: DUF465 domain-containing protein [Nitrospinota bacterium]|nr:DUF465 domain-containing protein [Nitrospinota bacterium]MDH5756331.1 DUF465 domain-containing protein [Nitrospinota bacterium]
MTTNPVDTTEQKLLDENEEYKKLYTDHLHYESVLEEFQQKKFLTPEEDLEFKRIKKLKLAGKDRMTQLLEDARPSE